MGAQVKAWMRETTYLTLALGFALLCFWQSLGQVAGLAYELGVDEAEHDSLHVDREIEAFLKRAAVVPLPRQYGGGIAWVLVSCEEKP